MTSTVYSGPFDFTSEHCSRWLTGPPSNARRSYPGRLGAGVQTMTTSEGDLVITYEGHFVFSGDVTTPDFTSRVVMRFQVDGAESTGVFEGGSGRGVIRVSSDTGDDVGRMVGMLSGEG